MQIPVRKTVTETGEIGICACKGHFDNIGSVAVVVIFVITMVICIALKYYVGVYKHVK